MAIKMLSVDPATGKVLHSYTAYNDKKVERGIQNAKKAFNTWKDESYAARASVLNKIAAALRNNKENLAKLATAEMGKPIQQGREEVEKCAVTLEYYAQEAAGFLAQQIIATEARKSYVAYRPLGVILGIMPWNFPYWQVFRALAPALMAGNVMVLKHASNVCGCALAIEEVMKEAGAPEGLLSVVLVPASGVESIIGHPAIAAVTLTGSTEAGRRVAEAAGRNLKKAVLELGGSDAYVVLDDADIPAAAAICVNGRLKNSGQSCVAAKRFIVTRVIKNQFEAEMVRQMNTVAWGHPLDEKNIVGPMARIELRNQLHEQVLKSVAMGAKLLCGGYIPGLPGAYYPPTVLANVKKGMPAYDDELFGPVAAIIESKNEADSMRIANDSEFGLGGAVLSRDWERAEVLALNELEAGSCFVNDFVHSDPRLPFGGIKNSGYGREIGPQGIMEFVNVKTVYIK